MRKEIRDRLKPEGQKVLDEGAATFATIATLLGIAVILLGFYWLYTIDWRIAVGIGLVTYGRRAIQDIFMLLYASIFIGQLKPYIKDRDE